MVSSNGVDGAVFQAFEERGPVFRTAERGIHLETALFLEIIFAEHQIVRRGLAGDADARALGFPDQRDTLFG